MKERPVHLDLNANRVKPLLGVYVLLLATCTTWLERRSQSARLSSEQRSTLAIPLHLPTFVSSFEVVYASFIRSLDVTMDLSAMNPAEQAHMSRIIEKKQVRTRCTHAFLLSLCCAHKSAL